MPDPLIGQSNDPNTAGVLGEGGTGVYGRNTTPPGNGVIGFSEKARGVWGHSITGFGVLGESLNGRGVVGSSETDYGIRGHSNKSAGIRGSSDEGRGVEGWAINSEGVVGISTGAGTGVAGSGTTGAGVKGASKTGYGVQGDSEQNDAVVGIAHANGKAGVLGLSPDGNALAGISDRGNGIFAKGGDFAAVFEGRIFHEGDHHCTGTMKVDTDLQLTGADCAEHFDVSSLAESEPGTVMVINQEGALQENQQAYDKRVAGVISGAGDFRPGLVLDKRQSRGNRLPIALLGKAFCKVDAQFGAIEVGDLLTTSSTPGHAMKAGEPLQAFGAVIGKALRPLKEGQGLIPILIALQ
jgi:hypothetical protein